jgi:hypothetical protein
MTGESSHAPDFWRYGVLPQQVEGLDSGGRPFYFRARHGEWELWRGPVGAEPDYLRWADRKELVAEGPDEGLTPDAIDELLTARVGPGWTHAEPS